MSADNTYIRQQSGIAADSTQADKELQGDP